jgi:hypothetical protein
MLLLHNIFNLKYTPHQVVKPLFIKTTTNSIRGYSNLTTFVVKSLKCLLLKKNRGFNMNTRINI